MNAFESFAITWGLWEVFGGGEQIALTTVMPHSVESELFFLFLQTIAPILVPEPKDSSLSSEE